MRITILISVFLSIASLTTQAGAEATDNDFVVKQLV